MGAGMTNEAEAVGSYEAKSIDDLRQIKTDAQVYASEEVRRDVGVPPPQKSYSYPTEYKATAPYEQVLRAQSAEWSREADLNAGKVSPGKVTDYPGELGLDDESGIYSATVFREVEEERARVAEASAESDPEEYEN